MEQRVHRLTRREFLRHAATGAASIAAPMVFVPRYARAQQRILRILAVSHFVPSFDAWFDPFAERWGRERGV